MVTVFTSVYSARAYSPLQKKRGRKGQTIVACQCVFPWEKRVAHMCILTAAVGDSRSLKPDLNNLHQLSICPTTSNNHQGHARKYIQLHPAVKETWNALVTVTHKMTLVTLPSTNWVLLWEAIQETATYTQLLVLRQQLKLFFHQKKASVYKIPCHQEGTVAPEMHTDERAHHCIMSWLVVTGSISMPCPWEMSDIL